MPLHPTLLASFLLAALAFIAPPASAGGKAGDFDFYVLALTWTPGYCATDDHPDPSQCRLAGAGFLVHGLWPEYETGYPDYCPSSLSRGLKDETLASVRDVMPSASLAHYEWRKHGLCSGLGETAYFATLSKAARTVAIPPALTALRKSRRMTPDEIEAAFVAANPGLSSAGMAVQCTAGRLSEVRICLTKDLAFRRCDEVDDDGCRAKSVTVLPAH